MAELPKKRTQKRPSSGKRILAMEEGVDVTSKAKKTSEDSVSTTTTTTPPTMATEKPVAPATLVQAKTIATGEVKADVTEQRGTLERLTTSLSSTPPTSSIFATTTTSSTTSVDSHSRKPPLLKQQMSLVEIVTTNPDTDAEAEKKAPPTPPSDVIAQPPLNSAETDAVLQHRRRDKDDDVMADRIPQPAKTAAVVADDNDVPEEIKAMEPQRPKDGGRDPLFDDDDGAASATLPLWNGEKPRDAETRKVRLN